MGKGSLYLIPVPLGANSDINTVIPEQARRLAATLRTFIVEHPKTARQFLKQTGTAIPLQEIRTLRLDEHTHHEELEALLQPLLAGEDVGLLSEAGCPAVADPGANLVRLAHSRNIRVIPLVGPSSILLALMASGLNGQSFAFLGYLPAEKMARVKKIAEIELVSQRLNQTQIFIETPYRNNQLLQDLLETCDTETELCVASDLTLTSEQVMTKCIGEWKNAPPDYNKRPTVFLLYRRRSTVRITAPRQKR
ncbi:MAG: SAM-dependent methyltransferase [Sulfuricella sp.]|jgi:16S rRNA (cytidine1402-2'-O)-methyltransferase|nr:SAM-dependent methyltransferase [Sulfuricella sp.]